MGSGHKRSFWLLLFLAFFAMLVSGCVSVPPVVYPKNYIEIEWANFNPAKKEIVIAINKQKYSGIFVVNYQGKVLRWLGKNTDKTWYGFPRYDFKGQRIALASLVSGRHSEIYIMDSDGKNIKRVTNTTGFDQHPSFSHDGNKIFFVRAKVYKDPRHPLAVRGMNERDLYWVDLSTGAVHRLTHGNYNDMDDPQALPGDKEVLVYLRGSKTKKGWPVWWDSLWIINVANPEMRKAIHPNEAQYRSFKKAHPSFGGEIRFDNLRSPALSRDGKYLAFQWGGYSERSYSQIYLCDMRTMRARPITSNYSVKFPVDIGPGSRQILFVDYSNHHDKVNGWPTNLWIMNLDGTGRKNINLDFSAVAGQAPAAENKAGGKP